jgi:uncharacterized protein
MSELPIVLARFAQCLFLAVGGVLLLRYVQPRVRAQRPPSPLAPWPAPLSDLLIMILFVLGGGLLGSIAAAVLVNALGFTGDRFTIFSNVCAQLGLLSGVGMFCAAFPGRFMLSPPKRVNFVLPGLAAFAMGLPFIYVTGLVWGLMMKAVGLPVDSQLAIDLFERVDSLPWYVTLTTTAVIVAPVTEEMIFRAGIFRHVRTRLPRWAALLLPACLFAALHVHLATFAQLTVLGVIFALAYERTGHIGTPIVAHAAFNLNMVLLLMTGVRD